MKNRLLRKNLPDLRHVTSLLQIIHFSYVPRMAYPNMIISASKIDLKATHQRTRLCGFIADMLLTIVSTCSLLSLRLPFGGSYCPFWWCVVSKITRDVDNALLRCMCWKPESVDFRNKSKMQSQKIDKDSRPLVADLPVDVLVDPDHRRKIFYYIDALITL